MYVTGNDLSDMKRVELIELCFARGLPGTGLLFMRLVAGMHWLLARSRYFVMGLSLDQLYCKLSRLVQDSSYSQVSGRLSLERW